MTIMNQLLLILTLNFSANTITTTDFEAATSQDTPTLQRGGGWTGGTWPGDDEKKKTATTTTTTRK